MLVQRYFDMFINIICLPSRLSPQSLDRPVQA